MFTLYLVSRISLVKPEKGRGLEDFLISAAQKGQIRNRLSESDLLGILEDIEAQESKQRTSKIVVLVLCFIFASIP